MWNIWLILAIVFGVIAFLMIILSQVFNVMYLIGFGISLVLTIIFIITYIQYGMYKQSGGSESSLDAY